MKNIFKSLKSKLISLFISEKTKSDILAWPKDVPNEINYMAKVHGYRCIDYQKEIGLVSYSKVGVRINIYLTKMTVATCINHPKHGKTQLFRKRVSFPLLQEIFKNPRLHTSRGYCKK